VIRVVAAAVVVWVVWLAVIGVVPGGRRVTLISRIIDGDTVVDRAGRRIRVGRIDAPDGGTVRGRLATWRLRFLLWPRLVVVVPTDVDDWGREVGRVWVLGVVPVHWLMVLSLGAAPWDWSKSKSSPLRKWWWRVLVGKRG